MTTTEKTKREDIKKIYEKKIPFLIEEAHRIHSDHFSSPEIIGASLLSIKTGGCSENCSYCPQSAHYSTGIQKKSLLSQKEVIAAAQKAKKQGAIRFCMGAAWKKIKEGSEFNQVLDLVQAVRLEGLETCCTLGMLTLEQAQRLKEVGLDFYNHNIDTSKNFYSQIIQTHTYEDRIQTLQHVRKAGLAICTGGILGLGEKHEDRIDFIHQLASFSPPPESITLNTLVPFAGTPLEGSQPIETFDLLRVIATLRITHPTSFIRLSAGRLKLSQETQFLSFYAGANSLFLGETLLTSPNPQPSEDHALLERLGYTLKQ